MFPLRYVVAFALLFSHAVPAVPQAAAQPSLLPPLETWTLEGLTWRTQDNNRELTTSIRYVPVRLISPTVPVKPGQLFTAEMQLATRIKVPSGLAPLYSAWIELEFLQGNKSTRVLRSQELKGTQPEQLLAVTGEAPPGATAARLNLCAQNRIWSAYPNGVRPRLARLSQLAGHAGDLPRIEVAQPLPKSAGDRKALLLVRGNWPDGTAVGLSSDQGQVTPSVILRKGRGNVQLNLVADEFGITHITTSVNGATAPVVALNDPFAGTLRVGGTVANATAPNATAPNATAPNATAPNATASDATAASASVFIEVSRNGKILPGRYVSPSGFFVRLPWQIELGPGQWRVRVLRGPHFAPVQRDVEVRSGKVTDLSSLPLKKVVDVGREGWFAGDADGDVYHGERIYTDLSAETAAIIGRASGLDWLGAGSWGTPSFKTWGELQGITEGLSAPDFRFYWTDEQPKSKEGHICSIGLKRPAAERFGEFRKGIYGLRNYEILAALRANGAATFVNHPLRWWTSSGAFSTNMYSSLPFDLVAAGLIDGLNINEGGAKVLDLWSLLLDHGYRVAATGGADFGLDRPTGPLPGLVRLYVHAPEGPSGEGLAQGICQGRTIVSTGPILLADIEGQLPGSTVSTAKTHRVRVRAWSRRDQEDPLKRVELWSHGKPLLSRSVATVDTEETFDWQPQGKWDWVAVRAVSKKGWAMTSAFYAAAPDWKSPKPMTSKVTLKMTGVTAKDRAAAVVECWDNWPDAPSARRLMSQTFKDTDTWELPATATVVVRLRDGRQQRMRLYEASGAEDIIKDIMSGRRKEEPLLKWETYQEVLNRLRVVTVMATFR